MARLIVKSLDPQLIHVSQGRILKVSFSPVRLIQKISSVIRLKLSGKVEL